VRIRLGNLGPMDHHPIHIHGHAFAVVETDGGAPPRGHGAGPGGNGAGHRIHRRIDR
jgi:FtsP/CotA-like multicopper oxidase with cupredoxin domain